MTIAFFGNFMSHHETPLGLEFERLVGAGNYHFIACEPLHSERAQMGYEDMNNKYDFVVRPYENQTEYQKALDIAKNVDVAIIGSASLIYSQIRKKNNKLTFLYRERLFKNGTWRRFQPWTAYKVIRDYTTVRNKNFYLLGASAYAGYDVRLCGFKANKCLKWGYFPEFEPMQPKRETSKPLKLLWCGRMIWWKHVECAVEVVRMLKERGVEFSMKIVGSGEKEGLVQEMIDAYQVSDKINRLPFVKPSEVRNLMKEADVFLFTSGREEGWGVVLNEAMNCQCAVIANTNAGSVPYLLKDNESGFCYDGTLNSLEDAVDRMLASDLVQVANNAYSTLANNWTPAKAAENLVSLSNKLLSGSLTTDIIKEGPCSRDLLR